MTNKASKASHTPKANGRPMRVLTAAEKGSIEKLAMIMASWDEISDFIGWPKSTLEKKQDAKDAYRIGMSKGKMSLKRAMFKNATENMNSTMQIWLSKIHLGYKEQQVVEVPADQGPMLVSIGAMPR